MTDTRKCQHGEVFVCTKTRMLEYLRKKGFIPFKTLPELTNPKYLNWYFKNSPDLEDAINSYFEQQRARRAASN